MNDLEALWWCENTPGLRITVGKGKQITLFMEHQIEVTAIGILDAVIQLQKILKEMKVEMQTCG